MIDRHCCYAQYGLSSGSLSCHQLVLKLCQVHHTSRLGWMTPRPSSSYTVTVLSNFTCLSDAGWLEGDSYPAQRTTPDPLLGFSKARLMLSKREAGPTATPRELSLLLPGGNPAMACISHRRLRNEELQLPRCTRGEQEK